MTKQQKPESQWELHVRGTQCEPLEADLMAQIVVMLGRQLAQETMTEPAVIKDALPTEEASS
jgi:hypothetical protein